MTTIQVCECCGKWRVVTDNAKQLPWLEHNHLLKAFQKFTPHYVICSKECEEEAERKMEVIRQAAGSVH